MRGDAGTVPCDAGETVNDRSIRGEPPLTDDIFELTGALTIPTDPVGEAPLDPSEYTPVVDLDGAPDPYPEGFEIMGSSTIPTDPEGFPILELPEFDPVGPAGPVGPKVDPYDAGAVMQARTKPGPEPRSFAVAVVKARLVPESVNAYTPVGTIYDIAADAPASDDVNKIPISVGEPAVALGGALGGVPDYESACPEEPDPYDKHAPRQGLLCRKDVPCRWYDIETKPALKDRDGVFEVRYGDHVAFFGREDADAVAALLPLHPEKAQPSANKETLVRLRLNLALGSGTPPCDLVAMNDVARMFQDALEPAGDDASVAADELEACLQKWVLEPTRYGPFNDLAGAVDFMRLPVRDGRVVGVALKDRYVSKAAAARAIHATKTGATTNVTSTSMQLRSEPKVEFARVSIWNEPPRATDDVNDIYMKPLQIDGS
jgi:hypothetical protein